ncbi:sensory rhodopsin transducer [Salibacterium sp. K-3]
MIGNQKWIIPDGFLQPKSSGEQISHEAVCVLNLEEEPALIRLTFYFEDRAPMNTFTTKCSPKRTHHIRLDEMIDENGQEVPRDIPYAIEVNSSVPIVVQHSRLDTSQEPLALFTTMAYSG